MRQSEVDAGPSSRRFARAHHEARFWRRVAQRFELAHSSRPGWRRHVLGAAFVQELWQHCCGHLKRRSEFLRAVTAKQRQRQAERGFMHAQYFRPIRLRVIAQLGGQRLAELLQSLTTCASQHPVMLQPELRTHEAKPEQRQNQQVRHEPEQNLGVKGKSEPGHENYFRGTTSW